MENILEGQKFRTGLKSSCSLYIILTVVLKSNTYIRCHWLGNVFMSSTFFCYAW